MPVIKYSHITTNGKTPIVATSNNHEIAFSPTHKYVFFSNELNDIDVFIKINNQDPIRVPSQGFVEIGEQNISTVNIEDGIGLSFEYLARY